LGDEDGCLIKSDISASLFLHHYWKVIGIYMNFQNQELTFNEIEKFFKKALAIFRQVSHTDEIIETKGIIKEILKAIFKRGLSLEEIERISTFGLKRISNKDMKGLFFNKTTHIAEVEIRFDKLKHIAEIFNIEVEKRDKKLLSKILSKGILEVEAVTKGFYRVRDYDTLTALCTGTKYPFAEKLLKDLGNNGENIVRCGIIIYRIITKISEDMRKYKLITDTNLIRIAKDRRKVISQPIKPDQALREAIEKLVADACEETECERALKKNILLENTRCFLAEQEKKEGRPLTKAEQIEKVIGAFFDNMLQMEGFQALGEIGPNDSRRLVWKDRAWQAGKRPNDALHFLIYYLAFHLKNKTGYHKYELILDFLLEQGIDCGLERKDVKEYFKRAKKEPLRAIYEWYCNLYVAPETIPAKDLDAYIRADQEVRRFVTDPTYLSNSFHELLPPWKDLFSTTDI